MAASSEAAGRAPETVPPEVRPFPRSADEVVVEPVAEGIIRLRLPGPYTARAAVNAFLLEDDDGYVLVDCGTSAGPGWAALARALELAGATPQQIRLLVCTHAHADHYGLASEVTERCGCPLALAAGPTASAELLRDTVVPLEQRLELVRRAGVPASLERAAVSHPGDDGHHPRPDPDILLEDGTEISTRSATWRVVPAPGHSPTQVVLFDDERGILLSADLAIPARIPYVEYGYTPDPWADHVESLRRAIALEPGLLVPGHGGPPADGMGLLVETLAATETSSGLVLAAIADRPCSAFEAVDAILDPDLPFYPRQVALSAVMCMLERLERLGAAASEEGENGALLYRAIGKEAA